MSVSNTNSIAQYNTDGVTTTFALSSSGTPIPFFAAGDWIITLLNISSGVYLSPAPTLGGAGTYDYTIATTSTDPNTGELIGNVVFNNAPPAGYRLTGTRSVAATSSNNFQNNAPFPAAQINAALDRAMMVAQQLANLLGFALQAPTSDPSGLSYALPTQQARAGQFLAFDSNGQPIASPGPITGVTVSAAMTSFVQAASIAAANAILGALTAGVNTPASAVTLKSTTAGAGVETFLTLFRNKGAGAANDFLEQLALDGMNASSAQKTFAAIAAEIVTATAAAEAGAMLLKTIVAGALTTIMTLQSGVQIGAPTGGDKGAGTLNASGIYVAGLPVFPGNQIKLSDTVAAGGNNAATTSSTWNQLRLQTKDFDTGGDVVGFNGAGGAGSNQFVLNAGTYDIDVSTAMGFAASSMSLRLRDTTAGSTTLVGLCGASTSSAGNTTPLRIRGTFTAIAGHAYEIDLWTTTGYTAGGINPASSGEVNVWTIVEMTRRA